MPSTLPRKPCGARPRASGGTPERSFSGRPRPLLGAPSRPLPLKPRRKRGRLHRLVHSLSNRPAREGGCTVASRDVDHPPRKKPSPVWGTPSVCDTQQTVGEPSPPGEVIVLKKKPSPFVVRGHQRSREHPRSGIHIRPSENPISPSSKAGGSHRV